MCLKPPALCNMQNKAKINLLSSNCFCIDIYILKLFYFNILLLCFFGVNAQLQDTISISVTPNQSPTFYNQYRFVKGLSSPNNARLDLFDSRIKEKIGIPTNYAGNQTAPNILAANYLGIVTYFNQNKFNLKERVEYGVENDQFNQCGFIQIALNKVPKAGEEYFIEFLVSLADHSRFATSGWGVYFSEREMANVDSFATKIRANISSTIMPNNKNLWQSFKEKYKFKGTEQYMIIGCFQNENYKTEEVTNATGFGLNRAYYYVSDFRLIENPPDADLDGIFDRNDRCPNQAGNAYLKGCPDADNDSIADLDDACPDLKGSIAFKGCPDTDRDSIADPFDKCPTVAGLKANGGCPEIDFKAETDKVVALLAQVSFSNNSNEFDAQSLIFLNDALLSIKNFNLSKIMLPQYADKSQQILSQKRRTLVMNYFLAAGLEASIFLTEEIGKEESNAEGRRIEVEIVNPK
jgi:outer membrane protein OmpA-like peptidoglycan-associated protein